jgi:sigma-B regulation protein RsbU (phosphoserine phosphatase)
MPAAAQLRTVYRRLGLPERALCAVVLIWSLFYVVWPSHGLRPFLQLGVYFLGGWCAIRWARRGIQKAVWRLRNRMVVAFLFIAFVPIVLVIVLAGLGAWALTHQLGIYLVTNEFNRRVATIDERVQWLASLEPGERADVARVLGQLMNDRYPGFEMVIRDTGVSRYPENSTLTLPPPGWGNARGVLIKDGFFYAWAHLRKGGLEIAALAPVTREFLTGLVPGLGDISLVSFGGGNRRSRLPRIVRPKSPEPAGAAEGQPSAVPPPVNRFDLEVLWGARVPASRWDSPTEPEIAILGIHSRISAILGTFFHQSVDWDQGLLLYILYLVSIVFFIAEAISVTIGVNITRTMTGAVHDLYEGTMRVMEGDFSHRIVTKGNDQVAELSRSFNRMTENLERLLAVAKESERVQAELEIAREVQTQLYPHKLPVVQGLGLTTRWQPARSVSGDYFDYQSFGDTRLAVAIGDVAGKGISAALLMATVQSCFRTQIRYYLEAAAAAGSSSTQVSVSTSSLVAQLNQQLHAFTTPEKFATFFFGLYDNAAGMFTYTNAGHLPPILFRNGNVQRLEVNGMVVGAFPFAQYDESRIQLNAGDLLVFFTDGITEPQNEYGEMFGEERLIEVIGRNVNNEPDAITAAVMDAVQQWTGSPELQDDMTLMLARRQ